MEFNSEFTKELFKEKINLEDIEKNISKTTLDDVCRLFKLQGVISEENLIKKLTCASINKTSFGLNGESGSGKTFIINKLINILPNVYKLNQTSATATFYDSENINNSNFLYIPELQKAFLEKGNSIIEIIKDITEGQNAYRIKTKNNRNGIDKQEIKKNLTIIYTLALENDFKPDKEFNRRFLNFYTNNNEEKIIKIVQHQAEQRIKPSQKMFEEEVLRIKLKKHLKSTINSKYNIIDPFAKVVFSKFPNNKEVINQVRKYSSIVDGYAKFYHNNHTKLNFGDKTYLITNLEDHTNVSKILESEINFSKEEFVSAKQAVKELTTDKYEDWFIRQALSS